MPAEWLRRFCSCVALESLQGQNVPTVETILGKSLGENYAGIPLSQILDSGSIPFCVVASENSADGAAVQAGEAKGTSKILVKGSAGAVTWENWEPERCGGRNIARFVKTMPQSQVEQYAMTLKDLKGNRHYLKNSTKNHAIQLHFIARPADWNAYVTERMSEPFTFGVTSLESSQLPVSLRDISTICFGYDRSVGRDTLTCTVIQCIRQVRSSSTDRIMTAPGSCHVLAFSSEEEQWYIYEAGSAFDGTRRTDLHEFIANQSLQLPDQCVAVSKPALFTTEQGTQLLAMDNMSVQDVKNMQDFTQKADAVECPALLQSKGGIFKHAQSVSVSGFLDVSNENQLVVMRRLDLSTPDEAARWVAMRSKLLVETAPL